MHKNFLDDIMICNQVYDKEMQQDYWVCTLVKNASYHCRNVRRDEKKGMLTERVVSIRIDARSECGKRFVHPDFFEDITTQYTLQSGDRIYKLGSLALQEFDWESGTLPPKCQDSCVINTFADNRKGILPHIYIQGE